MRPMRVPGIALCVRTRERAPLRRKRSAAPPPQPPPQPQKPVFRTGVDLLTVDATVVDREGKQDHRPDAGRVRRRSRRRRHGRSCRAEYIKLVDDTPVPVGSARRRPPRRARGSVLLDQHARRHPGRLIVLLVDEGNIRIGQGRDVMRSAVKFVDGLSPNDRMALVAIPRGAARGLHHRSREECARDCSRRSGRRRPSRAAST